MSACNAQQIDKNNDGYIELKELKDALDLVGFKLPGYEVRKMISEYTNKQRSSNPGKLSYEEFETLCFDLKAKDVASMFKMVVSKKENLETIGMSSQSADGTTHSVGMEEQLAFSDWINSNIGHDVDLSHLLPIDGEGRELYAKIKDGILLCKIINHSCPDTIDERAINKKNLTVYREFENLTLALVSSQAIGCNIVNFDAHDLAKGKPHLVLGLLWQIIRIGLFSHITLDSCPGLSTLLFDGERLEDLMKLSPEAILLRWVNHHLANAGISRRCTNFQSDIVDSEVYSHLLKQIAPNKAGVSLEALRERDMTERAEIMLQQAGKLNCRSFLTPQDVVNGVCKLNLAFVANLFNNHPGLNKPDQIEGLEANDDVGTTNDLLQKHKSLLNEIKQSFSNGKDMCTKEIIGPSLNEDPNNILLGMTKICCELIRDKKLEQSDVLWHEIKGLEFEKFANKETMAKAYRIYSRANFDVGRFLIAESSLRISCRFHKKVDSLAELEMLKEINSDLLKRRQLADTHAQPLLPGVSAFLPGRQRGR
ncbi:plastin-1-like [Bradysia coprophila]|uniref:plastin-1-like n=1 Tax=Bradysia coprophila TaxID=38358 RepID=UPI00187D8533|nr:plastin-1-like [Bradysia coprophila]